MLAYSTHTHTHTHTLIATNTSHYRAQCTPLTSLTITFLKSPLPAYFHFADHMNDMCTFPAIHLILDPPTLYHSIRGPPLLSYLILAPILFYPILSLSLLLCSSHYLLFHTILQHAIYCFTECHTSLKCLSYIALPYTRHRFTAYLISILVNVICYRAIASNEESNGERVES